METLVTAEVNVTTARKLFSLVPRPSPHPQKKYIYFFACAHGEGLGTRLETVSSSFMGDVTKIEVRSAVCCKFTGRTVAEL